MEILVSLKLRRSHFVRTLNWQTKDLEQNNKHGIALTQKTTPKSPLLSPPPPNFSTQGSK